MMQAGAFVFTPTCSVCGKQATHIELHSVSGEWRFRYVGITAGNGDGSIVSAARAALIESTFTNPPRFDLMREADLHYDNAGYCEHCGVAYCHEHWNVTGSGYGRCPEGHGKSLDLHWHPDD
jgi:hypothetical protein